MPHGRIVDSADAVDALPLVSEVQKEFNEDVVEVNRGLAVAYHRHAREGELAALAVTRSLDADLVEAPVWDVKWPVSSSKERF